MVQKALNAKHIANMAEDTLNVNAEQIANVAQNAQNSSPERPSAPSVRNSDFPIMHLEDPSYFIATVPDERPPPLAVLFW